MALLAAVRRRGVGVSQFVSAGHRADVSGNDLMQFWADDEGTDVVGLYLESLGNPRKFSRVARRLSLIKPVIVVTAGRSGQVVPPGTPSDRPTRHRARSRRCCARPGWCAWRTRTSCSTSPRCWRTSRCPPGGAPAILASSASVAALVAEAVAAAGLVVSGHVQLLDEDAPPSGSARRSTALYDDPDSDVVVVVRIPTVGGPDTVLQEAVAASGPRAPGGPPWRASRPARPHPGADGPRRRRPGVDGARLQHP